MAILQAHLTRIADEAACFPTAAQGRGHKIVVALIDPCYLELDHLSCSQVLEAMLLYPLKKLSIDSIYLELYDFTDRQARIARRFELFYVIRIDTMNTHFDDLARSQIFKPQRPHLLHVLWRNSLKAH